MAGRYERAAQLYDRPVLRRRFGDLAAPPRGADFDPASCAPVPAGGHVRRVAGTPHYDRVIRGHNVPAIIAICGVGLVNLALVDPSKPLVRPL